jgi:methylmalonyl-CoA/ethylmalonyl-CoA epimerase
MKSDIADLASSDPGKRSAAATKIYRAGCALADPVLRAWSADVELGSILGAPNLEVTAGVAVSPGTFSKIHSANGSPRLAEVPPEQDAQEFELHFAGGVSLDVLTTREPGGIGAIARFLTRFGEGIQQVECRVTNVDRATEILKEKFGVQAVYPETRGGAGGTRVNFFLVSTPAGQKVLIELYENPTASR